VVVLSAERSPHSISSVLEELVAIVQNAIRYAPAGVERGALGALQSLEEQYEAACAERDRISREAVGAVLKWSDRAIKAETALRDRNFKATTDALSEAVAVRDAALNPAEDLGAPDGAMSYLDSNPASGQDDDEEYVRKTFASHIGETAGAQNQDDAPASEPKEEA
jgi:hypothetical protein